MADSMEARNSLLSMIRLYLSARSVALSQLPLYQSFSSCPSSLTELVVTTATESLKASLGVSLCQDRAAVESFYERKVLSYQPYEEHGDRSAYVALLALEPSRLQLQLVPPQLPLYPVGEGAEAQQDRAQERMRA